MLKETHSTFLLRCPEFLLSTSFICVLGWSVLPQLSPASTQPRSPSSCPASSPQSSHASSPASPLCGLWCLFLFAAARGSGPWETCRNQRPFLGCLRSSQTAGSRSDVSRSSLRCPCRRSWLLRRGPTDSAIPGRISSSVPCCPARCRPRWFQRSGQWPSRCRRFCPGGKWRTACNRLFLSGLEWQWVLPPEFHSSLFWFCKGAQTGFRCRCKLWHTQIVHVPNTNADYRGSVVDEWTWRCIKSSDTEEECFLHYSPGSCYDVNPLCYIEYIRNIQRHLCFSKDRQKYRTVVLTLPLRNFPVTLQRPLCPLYFRLRTVRYFEFHPTESSSVDATLVLHFYLARSESSAGNGYMFCVQSRLRPIQDVCRWPPCLEGAEEEILFP